MVFKGSTEEMHVNAEDGMAPGHPVHTFKSENEEIKGKIGILFDKIENGEKEGLREGFEDLIKIEKHYSRKKNIIIFPLLKNTAYMACTRSFGAWTMKSEANLRKI
jgi:hypothetical protein